MRVFLICCVCCLNFVACKAETKKPTLEQNAWLECRNQWVGDFNRSSTKFSWTPLESGTVKEFELQKNGLYFVRGSMRAKAKSKDGSSSGTGSFDISCVLKRVSGRDSFIVKAAQHSNLVLD